ncbi:putative pentatricopeptide repeat-containing protein At3g23330 [Wolffia australiana]
MLVSGLRASHLHLQMLESPKNFGNAAASPPSDLSWAAAIRRHASRGQFNDALALFLSRPAKPNRHLLPSLLKSCAVTRRLKLGESLHGSSLKLGLFSDLCSANALLNLYAKLHGDGSVGGNGDVSSARKLFDEMPQRDLVTWNTVVAGAASRGLHGEAMAMVRAMVRAGLDPDSFTLSTVLPVFAELAAMAAAAETHGYALKRGLTDDVFVSSGLIDAYAKSSRADLSWFVFSTASAKDLVSWNAIIAGSVQNGQCDDAIRIFRGMLREGGRPGAVTFSSLLPACARATTLRLGRELHGGAVRALAGDNPFVASALVDMYAKSGLIAAARRVFDMMIEPDGVSWTAMIMGYALHGPAGEAVAMFRRMPEPNAVAFVAVLTACSHAGMVEQAKGFYRAMTEEHGISPGLEHCAAMADLLGRSGRLEEAYRFISAMPVAPTASVWAALLGACRVHKDVGLAETAAAEIFKLEPAEAAAKVLMANIYAAAGRWKEAAAVRVEMKRIGVKKEPGCSWVAVKDKVHVFAAEDRSHPRYEEIRRAWGALRERMEREEGYVANTEGVLHDVEEEQKRDMLEGHSERLAIVFAIMSTAPGTVIRVTKNLRVCVDCHAVSKVLAKMVGREIVVRDVNRFHHFSGGHCSCGDFW